MQKETRRCGIQYVSRIYLEAEFLSSVKERLKPGMSGLFADPQARPSMPGNAEDATQLQFDISGLFCQIERLDGIVNESAVRAQDAYFELAFVDRPPPSV
jgi:hypothetical protein